MAQGWVHSLLGWLSADPSGWLGVLVAVGAVLAEAARRTKKNTVVVREVKRVQRTLLGPWLSVHHVAQLDFEISQKSVDVLENVQGHFLAPPESTILGAWVRGEGSSMERSAHDRRWQLKIPYLNSASKYQHTILVRLVVSRSTTSMRIFGMGPGWSILHLRLSTQAELERFMYKLASFYPAFMVTLVAYSFWLNRVFGIDPAQQWSMPYAPLWLALAGSAFWMVHRARELSIGLPAD